MATVKNHTRRWLFAATILAASLLTTSLPSLADNDEPLSSVADLRYGATLYEYYQGNYFEALSELMVAEERGGIQGHTDNPKLIEGGINLSFGMEQTAGDIFNELLASDANGEFTRPLEVRNAAWFYLGKLRYLRGDWDGTEASFKNISGRFDKELVSELEALAINLAIRRNDLATAESELRKARNLDDWRHLIYFNMGNAYSRAQQYDKAIDYYDRLANLPISDLPSLQEEQLVLYDKALTAAGYNYILQGEHRKAINRFKQVRLKSDFSNRALLGYGWAAAENNNHRLALRPWQELSKRSLTFPSVQEALIAVPYAYEKLKVPGQALIEYQNAEQAFENEIARIQVVMDEMNDVDLLTALKIKETDNKNWFLLNEKNGVQPHIIYLTELFSLNQFQGSVQELRDLLHISERLNDWKDRLDAYSFMLDQREIKRADQVERLASRNLAEQLTDMMARRNRLTDQLNTIESERDYLSLADGDQKELYDIVLGLEEKILRLKNAGEDVEEYEAVAKRYRGLLYWNASEASAEKRWQVRSNLKALNDGVLEAETNLDRFQRVVAEAPDIEPYRIRISSLNTRLTNQSRQVDAAVALAETTLRRKISGELARQQMRLQHYMSQARLAVARLYDLAVHGDDIKRENPFESLSNIQQQMQNEIQWQENIQRSTETNIEQPVGENNPVKEESEQAEDQE
ncbi:MAG: tetratricopeptide repeat protein [Cellvibrionaceae bacterium]